MKLLTPGLLADINEVIVEEGDALAGCNQEAPLQAWCDSIVVGTAVHFPTDIYLMRDAERSLTSMVTGACKALEIG